MTETIATSARIEPFIPPSLGERKPLIVLWIKTPTPLERDTLSSTLYRMGLREVTQEIVRATLIDELYEMYPEGDADEKAAQLDSFWQISALDERSIADWHEQEQQRLLDVEHGLKDSGPIPMPTALTTPRQKAKARLLVDEITNQSERMLKILERRMDFGRQQGLALVRLGVVGLSDDETEEPVALFDVGPDGAMTMRHAERLRELLPDNAWLELIQRIDEGFSLSEEERKNSGSPRGNGSAPNGSREPSGESASNDGKWTGSSTGPVPADESVTTTAPSSSTSSEQEGSTATTTPMADPPSTSQSA